MQYDIITIFPQILDSYINESILKRAQDKGLLKINFWNLRDFTSDKHRSADDTPYGGGPGMVLKVEPIYKCLKQIKNAKLKIQSSPAESAGKNQKTKIILLSPKGSQFNQRKAEEFSKLDQLILICGRYEGIDARIENLVDEQISIGPYVLSGGELPAMAVVEAVVRLLPGVLGCADSLSEESYHLNQATKDQTFAGSLIEYPQYTRPEVFKPVPGVEWRVPEVLLSGDHQKIAQWRKQQMSAGANN